MAMYGSAAAAVITGATSSLSLDEEYQHLQPHAFHLQLPSHHKTAGGIPFATIDAHRKARAIVKLVDNLKLKESFFVKDDSVVGMEVNGVGSSSAVAVSNDDDDDDDIDDADDIGDFEQSPTSLYQFSLHCQRLHYQLVKLSECHYNGGITQLEICQMILKVLGLLCATVEMIEASPEDEGVSSLTIDENTTLVRNFKSRAIIRYDYVGCCILGGDTVTDKQEDTLQPPSTTEELLSHPFALPSPVRLSLLNIALHLLGNKKNTLRGVSNSAIVMPDDNNNHQRLILSDQALLRMLLRTAPYLDEHQLDVPPNESIGTRSGILKKSVSLIRSCRRFFDQKGGVTASTPLEEYIGKAVDDTTAQRFWSSLRNDLQFHSHSNSCFRALILLYLFHPSKCSSNYYKKVLPLWMECWRNIDRCPEWDYLWMVLFSRARKYLPLDDDESYNIWSTLRKHLLTSCKYWLQIPVGGISADKSFPHAKEAGIRSIPPRLKAFVGMGSQYDEGMNFVGILTKLLMFCTATATAPGNESNDSTQISEGTSDILRFLSFIAPYFNPSNSGSWSFPIGAFLHYLSYELCSRVGVMAGLKVLQREHTVAALKLLEEDPYLLNVNLNGREIVALMDGMLPLCQQILYSKNPTISHAGETALLYLAQIDPSRVTPPLLDFSMRALDVSSVNLSHQAPAALATISRLLQPALRARKNIVLSRLPDCLRLSLAGIDGNDQNKSLRTLIFYRNLVMWLPVGGGSIRTPSSMSQKSSLLDRSGNDGTLQIGTSLMKTRYSVVNSEEYIAATSALPPSSILASQTQEQSQMILEEDDNVLMQEAMCAMIDWSQMFLDRIYELLRAAGEQEKLGKGQGGVGLRHTSHDVAITKNFSRIMKETLIYLFAAMDKQAYDAALHSVVHFLQKETLPYAAKDASLLCQAVCSTRFAIELSDDSSRVDRSPGIDALVPVLTEDLHLKSKKCAVYRLRCLAGAVRYAGSAVLQHCEAVTKAISFALSNSDDRVLFKTGCKLLRHVLSSQCEEYPIAQCVHPMRINESGNSFPSDLGISSRLREDAILWHVPSGEQLDFSVSLLAQFSLTRWNELGNSPSCDEGSVNLQQWRQTLRVMRYALRGCSGILLDGEIDRVLLSTDNFSPKEMATAQLMLTASIETRNIVQGLRRRLCSNLLDVMCLIANETIDCESKTDWSESENSTKQFKSNEFGPIGSDSKILNEIIQLSELLVARRGAHAKSRNGKSIYRGQKELLADFVLASEAEFLSSVLSRCNDSLHTTINHSKFKDGEDSGKTISRALLVGRIHLSCQDLTANASTQILKRLRKLRSGAGNEASQSLFSLDMTLQTVKGNLGIVGPTASERTSLALYEALIDGLCALACHPNINVRGKALTAVDFTLSRLGWVIKQGNRLSRLLSAISLTDVGQKGAHGIPCTAQLVHQVNSQGKRSRLAEVVKGVTKIVAIPRVLKHFQWSEMNRFELVQTLCGTQKMLQLVPAEEVAKVVHYINQIFLALRSKLFSLPRSSNEEQATHEACLSYLLGVLRESKKTTTMQNTISKNDNSEDAGAMHWRDRLVAAWFILTLVDERDLIVGDPNIVLQLWTLCSTVFEAEIGQPLQRVSLGILGRLVSLSLVDMAQTTKRDTKKPDLSPLRVMFSSEKICRAFGNALVFDHREDTSVSGGHGAQWSSGIEEIIRDSTNNIALRTLFPFNRTSQKSFTFKIQHSQLIFAVLQAIGHENAKVTASIFLEHASELVSALPSEDQRNQQVTSAEIFGGVSRALIQYSSTDDERNFIWDTMLLPFLDGAVVKMPTNLLGSFFDSCRYCIHHFPPRYFFPLLKWSCSKVQSTLWQHTIHEDVDEGNIASSTMSDRFALQGKWILILQAVIVELDNEDDLGALYKPPFYTKIFAEHDEHRDDGTVTISTETELNQSWKHVNDQITPCLLNAIAHPYDKCRDHIASCLFQMCYCHRKFAVNCKPSRNGNESASISDELEIQVIKRLSGIRDLEIYSFKERVRALGTARKFIACCVHWGDAKHEYSDFIIPLLPLVFYSLQTFDEKISPEDLGIEADLVKGFRYAIAEISSSCVARYGVSEDMTRVLGVLKEMSTHQCWQIRQASAHFLRSFQGVHKFLFTKDQEHTSLSIAISLLTDDRREVSSAATSTLTGILAMLPQSALEELVSKYISIANKSIKKKARKVAAVETEQGISSEEEELKASKEKARATRQQRSVFVLSAIVLGRPYDTPPYIPVILAALSKHSFEHRASLCVREVVKMVCGEYKRTHTDNWEVHRRQFTQDQLEALEDVVSTPHYYA